MTESKPKLLKCPECHTYTMEEACKCGGKAYNPIPPKFSPADKYGTQRRKMLYERD